MEESPSLHIKIFTVSELTGLIGDVFDKNFDHLCVEGEVSNLRVPSSGHHYFTLKDEKSQIRAVLFRGARQLVPFDIKDGQKVICLGRLGLYAQRGEYQIIVEQLEPSGLGSLHLAFEQLKERLEKEGLFDEARKRPLPLYPKRIGLVTSATGAAVRDILRVLERRGSGVDVLIAPAMVQGEGAAREIAEAVRNLNLLGNIDVLIVGRGGGSLEDLWPFNEEEVARAIYESEIPVVSAVGHERDFTIADFAADMRAPTPSAAAEMVARSGGEVLRQIGTLRQGMTRSLLSKISILRESVEKEKRVLEDPRKKTSRTRMRIDDLLWRMESGVRRKVKLFKSELGGVAGRIDSLSPLAVLARGYSITTSWPEGKVVRDMDQVVKGGKVAVRLMRGNLLCSVLEISED